MAAQPLVRLSYKEPVNTFSTNVIGTVNVLEAARKCKNLKQSFVLQLINAMRIRNGIGGTEKTSLWEDMILTVVVKVVPN